MNVRVSLLLLAAVLVSAAGPSLEDRYIATRDAATARFTPAKVEKIGDQAMEQADRARDDLEKQMRAILGPIEIKGLGPGKLSLGSLFGGDLGFGTLDGLTFVSEDYKTEIVVTTRTLFTRWLRAHMNAHDDALPQRTKQAFRADTFYFHAIVSDSAILRFAELPLGAAAAKPAYAMAAARTQDQTPYAANEVFVAAIKGERAFVGFAPLEPKLDAPSCRAAREAAEKKDRESRDDPDAAQHPTPSQEKIDADFRMCFAKQAPKQAAFADAVKRAQELYARMPAR